MRSRKMKRNMSSSMSIWLQMQHPHFGHSVTAVLYIQRFCFRSVERFCLPLVSTENASKWNFSVAAWAKMFLGVF